MSYDSDSDNDIAGSSEALEASARPLTLLDKIKKTLASTPADRWQQGVDELDENRKHAKPQEVWEQVYCTDTKAGVLVLRSSTPIICNFFGGGYSFKQGGGARYLVELRSRGWSPKMLCDSTYRGVGGVEKDYQILAEGEIARQLFNEIDMAVKNLRSALKIDFNDSVQRLISSIREQVEGTAAEDWKIVEGENGYTGYRGDVNGMTVTVGALVRDSSSHYSMNFIKHGLRWDCRDSRLIKDVFSMVDESVRNASLEKLGKVLEEML
jgi:hypothetical protein